MASDQAPHRPTDATLSDRTGAVSYPQGVPNLPWIDVHNHAHTLSWTDREQFALTGCVGMVMMAAGYHWTPYAPAEPSDIQFLWDDAISRLHAITQVHPFTAKLGIGIHTGIRVNDYERLLAMMPAYCARAEVAVVGETGVTPTQHGARWDLTDQRDLVREHMAIAAEFDLPVVLHTPSNERLEEPYGPTGSRYWFEKDLTLTRSPVLDTDDPELECIAIDVELADDAGLPEHRIVLSHADAHMIPYVMEHTDCNVSFTLSYTNLRLGVLTDIIETIHEYGPDRVLLETDAAGVLRGDPSSMKRTIFELARRNIELDTIRQIVHDNQTTLLGWGE